jgi:hypothetical protein
MMLLAWTTADVRYRFRILTAPLPLQSVTFYVVASIGILTLLTDLWRAQQWLVPSGGLLTPAIWQALLGGLFLLTFLVWAWFAFIRPPIYGRQNAHRFAQTLYHFILKGSPTELAIIADEIARSAKALVRHATERSELKNIIGRVESSKKRPRAMVEAYANDLLLLIADKRLCREIVNTAPGTALAIFQEMGVAKKYGIPVETFAKNIVSEALANHNSFIFHETEGYDSGLIGYHKPLSQAMFSNYQMVETIGTLLDPDVSGRSKWAALQWEGYCRVVLITFRDYVDKQFWNHSFVLYRAKGYIEHAANDLYRLQGVVSLAWDNDLLDRLRVVVNFIKEAVATLDKKGVPKQLRLRIRERSGRPAQENFYDYLAAMIVEVIFSASYVKSPKDQCWLVQRNSVWGQLFNFHQLSGPAGKGIKFKVRRLLYNEIARMSRFANFKGANILGFCLNVMGLTIVRDDCYRDSLALHKAVLAWTRKNYVWLHGCNPRVAEECLVDGLTFEVENLRLVKTYPIDGLRREATHVYLKLDSAPVEIPPKTFK